MREFQEKHQVVDLDTQAKAVVSSMAALKGQRIASQMELSRYTRTFSSDDEATRRSMESKLSIVDDQHRESELAEVPEGPPRAGPRAGRPGRRSIFPAALEVPKLRAEYERLYRDRKVAEATLVFALERLEGAKATEARDVSTFQVLDPPARPTRKSRPSGLAALALSVALGLTAGVAYEWWRSSRPARQQSGAPPP